MAHCRCKLRVTEQATISDMKTMDVLVKQIVDTESCS